MKFNWGTGIFSFIVLFILLLAAFVVFTSRQGVNLVHKDYYEKGLKHDDKMAKEYRSKAYEQKIIVHQTNDKLSLIVDEALSQEIDSGRILLYRPSDMHKDVQYQLKLDDNHFDISKENLSKGRYILQFTWFVNGEDFEVDKTLNIK